MTDAGSAGISLWDFSVLKARILNMTNRNAASRTAGCCDRAYWGWKLKDFPDVSKQYALYPFALLMDETDFHERAVLKSQVMYWVRALQDDGSADQAFPREKSSGPTLYSAHAVLSAFPVLERILDAGERDMVVRAVRRALDFSIRTPELYGHIANHKALFAHAYLLGYRLTGDRRYDEAYRDEISDIIRHYTSGYFLEYETADPGYQTQCLHYLTLCFDLTGDEELKRVIKESLQDFSPCFLFPDGSYSGIITGRGTEILYPYAFFYWRDEIPACSQVCSFLYGAGQQNRLVSWPVLDFENMIRLGTNYLLCRSMTRDAGGGDTRDMLPCFRRYKHAWPEAGLAVAGDSRKYLMLNLKRGGIFKLVTHDAGHRIEDGGYVITQGDRRLTSALFEKDADISAGGEANAWHVKKPFAGYLENYLTVPKNILLRLLSLTLFRSPRLSMMVKRKMVDVLILHKEKSGFMLERSVEDRGGELLITDIISGTLQGKMPPVLSLPCNMLPFHMASAGYFSEGQLLQVPEYGIEKRVLDRLPVTIKTKIEFTGDGVHVHRSFE